MSYFRKIEYEMIPKDSFSVIRGCAKCGRKTHFTNTEKFRVNANGNKLDVWLIYQCEACKHTLNLAIYERQKVSSIPKEEYQRFLNNDEELARMYGRTMQLFQKNKAEIDFERVSVDFVKKYDAEENGGVNAIHVGKFSQTDDYRLLQRAIDEQTKKDDKGGRVPKNKGDGMAPDHSAESIRPGCNL